MEKMEFIKMHGLGNDFVVIDNRTKNLKISKEIINKISDRKFGAGCDQVIIIKPRTSTKEDASIEIFNPNGDKAEACGNGTRCVAKLLFNETKKTEVNIKSDAGILYAKNKGENISVNLGKLTTEWKKIPLSKNVDTLNIPFNIKNFSKGVAVNIGNPHIVFFGKKLQGLDLNIIGPSIENNELFPNKTNVEFVEIINKKKIKMKVWERGAGITLACGSGACASVYAGVLKNFLDKNVQVQLEKGSMYIEILNDEAIMTGPAEISYHGNIKI
tara:strand:- start:711 stop:1526 length:816 start_codon:yes stop_codon:yes gene_type:complete